MNTYTVPKLETFSIEEINSSFDRLQIDFETEIAALRKSIDAIDEPNEDNVSRKAEQLWTTFRNTWIADRNGVTTQVRDVWLRPAPSEAKKYIGSRFNGLKIRIDQGLNETYQYALQAPHWHGAAGDLAKAFGELTPKLKRVSKIDVTLPGIRRQIGAEHPVIKTSNEMVGIFKRMGYSVAEGPEIESDYYNFEALNFPPNHPARDTQDTLFVAGQEKKPQRERLLLRTHTSPVQIRAMEKQPPPIRIVVPGKVHRHDTPDASHSPIFHQIEGLAVDTNITFCDLKGTLDHAMKEMFGSSVRTRFYPSFFPFTEPSADVQISCFKCGGKGCALCKRSGWIEVLGCGMVDPHVFEFVRRSGYDPAKVSGFAFGMGVERIAILKYGIDDIQLFFNGDVRFLEQFA